MRITGAPPSAVFASYLIRFRTLPGVEPSYVSWIEESQLLEASAESASGIALQNINAKKLAALALPVAPTNEQRRIVAAIEEQFSRLDAGEVSLHAANRKLAALRDSTLQHSLGGEWRLSRVGEIASVGSGATPKRGRSEYWDDGTVPWVTSGQLTTPFVREPAAYITEQALKETQVKLWPKHTLLVAMYGEGRTRGNCSELMFESTTNQACAAVVITDDNAIERAYLKLFFAASYDANRRLASGGVQPNLSLGLIKSLRVPLPPLDEQRRIVAEVERQLSILDATKAAIESALERSKALRRAILERAFTGKLVPQDPTDEPASVLLERIAAERAAAAPNRPTRRRKT